MKYLGREFYIYVILGEVIDIRWKLMLFNDVNEDLIEFYYVNGVYYKEIFGLVIVCLCFLYFYVVVMNWLFFLIIYELKDFLFNYLGWYEICLIICVVFGIFGIYIVEYF